MFVTLMNYLQIGITLDLCKVVGERPVMNYHHNELSLKFDIKDFLQGESA